MSFFFPQTILLWVNYKENMPLKNLCAILKWSLDCKTRSQCFYLGTNPLEAGFLSWSSQLIILVFSSVKSYCFKAIAFHENLGLSPVLWENGNGNSSFHQDYSVLLDHNIFVCPWMFIVWDVKLHILDACFYQNHFCCVAASGDARDGLFL